MNEKESFQCIKEYIRVFNRNWIVTCEENYLHPVNAYHYLYPGEDWRVVWYEKNWKKITEKMLEALFFLGIDVEKIGKVSPENELAAAPLYSKIYTDEVLKK
jgi:hypothetical protein